MRGLFKMVVCCTFLMCMTPVILGQTTDPIQWSGNGHWYQFIAQVGIGDWESAKLEAERIGGYLATVSSAEENAFLVSILDSVHASAWLGGHEPNNDGVWLWVTGEPWQYTNWIPGQPSNTGGNENFLSLTESVAWGNGRWNDASSLLDPTVLGTALFEFDEYPVPTSDEFCNDFEDGLIAWENIYGIQTLVTAPTPHSGSYCVKFRGSNFGCHSVLKRRNFEASLGRYSAYILQQHYEAGLAINIQVQPDPDIHPSYRPCYQLEIHARDAHPPANFTLRRNDGSGGSIIFLNKTDPDFYMNEWVYVFIERSVFNHIKVGYSTNSASWDTTIFDPDPITEPGGFYISSCSDVTPTDNFYDDVCFQHLSPADSLYLPPHRGCLPSKGTTSLVLPLKVKNQTEITAINIPLKWNNANLILDSISHVGAATENWINNHVINNDSQKIVIASLNTLGSQPILGGWDTTVALLCFRFAGTCAHDSVLIAFDTTYSDEEQWRLLFGDNSNPPNEFVPAVSFADWKIYTVKPGDVSMNCVVNILDAAFLISCLYKGGVAPNPLFMGDVNCNGNINILDVSYLLAFLYKYGPAPVCCVPGVSLSTPPKQCACVTGEKSIPGGTITLASENGRHALVLRNSIGLSGLELILKATNRETVELKSAIDGIELHWSQNGDEIRAALIDLGGLTTIDIGERKIIEFLGEVEIISVLGADKNSNGVSFEIVNQATKEELLPKVYSLSQNHPNPFNPTTTFEFSLPKASEVELEIFNIAGQKIATLVNSRLEAGNHSITWDSRSTDGEPLASGIYLYRLKADEFVETKKMMLLK